MNVTLFHASLEKSDPTMATPRAPRSAKPASGSTEILPDATRVVAAFQNVFRFPRKTPSEIPAASPRAISAISAIVLAVVNVFWIHFPPTMPRVLMNVRTATLSMATSLWAVSFTGPAWKSTFVSPSPGKSTAVNFANATPTAAIVPV